jgi:hypothetical protein
VERKRPDPAQKIAPNRCRNQSPNL